MADYFFYGSLMDVDILSAVAGERIPPARLISARLVGYERLSARHDVFPIIVEDPGANIEGVLVIGLSSTAVRRLARYEGSGYVAAKRRVISAKGPCDAYVFISIRPGRSSGKPWDFESWRRRHKRRLLRALAEQNRL